MMSRKQSLIQITKVFTDKKGNSWWFNIEKFEQILVKCNYDIEKIQILVELSEEDEDKKIISKKTIGRVLQFFHGSGQEAVTLKTVKTLGKALCNGDEYGLLIPITPFNAIKVLREIQESYTNENLEAS